MVRTSWSIQWTIFLLNLFCVPKFTHELVLGSNNSLSISNQLIAYHRCKRIAIEESKRASETSHCATSFDGIACWKAVRAGTVAQLACSDSLSWSVPGTLVTRECLANGSWAKNRITGRDEADYSGCSLGADPPYDRDLLQRLIHYTYDMEINIFDDERKVQALRECTVNVLAKPALERGSKYCPRIFDGWSCWDDTPANSNAYAPCPSFVPGFLADRIAFKVCLQDGTWFRHPINNKTWSNYTTCVDREDLQFRQTVNNIYIIGYSISVVALIISLVIFLSFKSLKCTRITIHKNLFLSFIINNLMWILWYILVVGDADVLKANKAYCQLLHIVLHYFLLANYSWTFCEGLYLHTLLVVAFVAEEKIMKWFYVIGWGTPLLFISLYAGFRSTGSSPNDTGLCWIEDSKYQWWYMGPVAFSFLLNIFFLINIVRVLVTKMRAVNSQDAHQTRKAVKAILILLPLLGLHFLVTPFRPEPGAAGEIMYDICAALVASLQGLCVAILFCFCNGEVVQQFKKRWNRIMLTYGDNRRMSYAATSVSYIPRCNSDVQAIKSLKENGFGA